MLKKTIVKRLLKKTQMVRYCWASSSHTSRPLWCCEFIDDNTDIEAAMGGIFRDSFTWTPYDPARGIFLYKMVKDEFKLIASIKNDEIKLY